MSKLVSQSIGVASLVLVMFAPKVVAQSLFEACGADIGTHCTQVKPGNGRLSACLYAHEDKLSDSCDAAFGEMADVMDVVFERLRYATQQCGNDIAAHCSDVAIGQGQIFSCLHKHKASLSAGCLEVVDGVELPPVRSEN